MSRAEMLARTWAFLSPDLLRKVSEQTILNCGCGLSSNVAVLAAQHGFEKFINVDSDDVELSNLNRQAFTVDDIGRPKVDALADTLRAKNPDVSLDGSYVGRLTPDNAEHFVTGADLIVLTVDFDDTLYEICRHAREQGKPVFAPLNLGYSGFCLVLTPESATYEEMLGERVVDDFPEFLGRLAAAVEGWDMPEYLEGHRSNLAELMKDSETRGIPQLGIAAYRSSSIVVESMLKYLVGVPLPVAPRAITIDSYHLT